MNCLANIDLVPLGAGIVKQLEIPEGLIVTDKNLMGTLVRKVFKHL